MIEDEQWARRTRLSLLREVVCRLLWEASRILGGLGKGEGHGTSVFVNETDGDCHGRVETYLLLFEPDLKAQE